MSPIYPGALTVNTSAPAVWTAISSSGPSPMNRRFRPWKATLPGSAVLIGTPAAPYLLFHPFIVVHCVREQGQLHQDLVHPRLVVLQDHQQHAVRQVRLRTLQDRALVSWRQHALRHPHYLRKIMLSVWTVEASPRRVLAPAGHVRPAGGVRRPWGNCGCRSMGARSDLSGEGEDAAGGCGMRCRCSAWTWCVGRLGLDLEE